MKFVDLTTYTLIDGSSKPIFINIDHIVGIAQRDGMTHILTTADVLTLKGDHIEALMHQIDGYKKH